MWVENCTLVGFRSVFLSSLSIADDHDDDDDDDDSDDDTDEHDNLMVILIVPIICLFLFNLFDPSKQSRMCTLKGGCAWMCALR